MKKLILLLAVMTTCALGQGVFYNSNVTTSAKNVPPGAQAALYTLPLAQVTVCGYPAVGTGVCTNTTPIYNNQDLAPGHLIPQPLVADSEGRFQFWVDPSLHSYSIQTPAGKFVGTWPLSLNSQVGPQGPGGIGCGAANCIISAPTVTQTITQPTNSNLNVVASGSGQFQYKGNEVLTTISGLTPVSGVAKTAAIDQVVTQTGSSLRTNSFNSILYADQCAGTEMGARITNCIAQLPINTAGYKVGTIVLPNTKSQPTMAGWSTAVILGPGVNLQGQGIFSSSFTCTGAIDCLVHDASATTTGPFKHTTLVNTVYQGFTITGDGSAGQNIMHWKDAQGVTMRDVALDGASSSTSACLWLEDVNWWTERNNFSNVSSLYNCKKAILMSAQVSNPYQPHPSFGYNNFSDWKANPNGSQYVLYMTGNPYFYSSTFNLTFNKEGAGSIIIHQDGGSEFYVNETHIMGEDQGTGGYFLEQLSAGSIFTYTGNILYGITAQLNPASNPAAQFAHYGDPQQLGPLLPHLNRVDSQANFVQILPASTDLNTVLNCGRYEVAAPINAPAAIGANSAHVEVFCSNVNFKSQNVYLFQASGGVTRQWQRIDDNNTWGGWRELIMVPEGTPLSTKTCTVLPTVINGVVTSC